MRGYKVQLGKENVPLKSYTIEAHNLDEARAIAQKLLNEATNFGNGPEWYDYISVKPARKENYYEN